MEPIDPPYTDPLPEGWDRVLYAKDQPGYRPLPSVRSEGGEVVTSWSLSLRERVWLALTGKVYFTILTFNAPLQPILPSVVAPELEPPAPPPMLVKT